VLGLTKPKANFWELTGGPDIGVNPGGWRVTTPRFWAGSHRDRRGIADGSRNIIISYFGPKLCYFAKKVSWKWFVLKKKRDIFWVN